MKPKRFVAEMALVLALSLGPLPAPAGIPVIDAGNLTQNILTAMESVAQTDLPAGNSDNLLIC